MSLEFQSFGKIARLSREAIVTEKIDGTNAQIYIVPKAEVSDTDELVSVYKSEAMVIFAGSRNRWITPKADNYGFAKWVQQNAEELLRLGPGRHFGEWWGAGIQRRYGQTQKRFSLFNVNRWVPQWPGNPFSGVYDAEAPFNALNCCQVVPTIWRGNFDTSEINDFVEMLGFEGSFAAPGFKQPEGLVVYHTASGTLFKKTLEHDESPKTLVPNPDWQTPPTPE